MSLGFKFEIVRHTTLEDLAGGDTILTLPGRAELFIDWKYNLENSLEYTDGEPKKR